MKKSVDNLTLDQREAMDRAQRSYAGLQALARLNVFSIYALAMFLLSFVISTIILTVNKPELLGDDAGQTIVKLIIFASGVLIAIAYWVVTSNLIYYGIQRRNTVSLALALTMNFLAFLGVFLVSAYIVLLGKIAIEVTPEALIAPFSLFRLLFESNFVFYVASYFYLISIFAVLLTLVLSGVGLLYSLISFIQMLIRAPKDIHVGDFTVATYHPGDYSKLELLLEKDLDFRAYTRDEIDLKLYHKIIRTVSMNGQVQGFAIRAKNGTLVHLLTVNNSRGAAEALLKDYESYAPIKNGKMYVMPVKLTDRLVSTLQASGWNQESPDGVFSKKAWRSQK